MTTTSVSSSIAPVENYATSTTTHSSPWMGRQIMPINTDTQSTTSLAPLFSSSSQKRKAADEIGSQAKRLAPSSDEDLSPEELFLIEKTYILDLPYRLREMVGSYIDPTDTIIELLKKNVDIPKYLQDHARHIEHLYLSEIKLTKQQTYTLLSFCRNLKTLEMPILPQHKLLNHRYQARQYNEDELDNTIMISISTLSKLYHLNMSNWERLTVDSLKMLIDNENLQYLNINNCIRITRDGILLITDKCKNLTHLEIGKNPHLTNGCIALLEKMTTLRHLNVSSSQISDEALKSISTFTNLESLDISNCESLTDEGFKTLGCLYNLKSLNLSGTNISKEGVSYLAALSKLEVLNLKDCKNVNNGAILTLKTLTNLKTLITVNTVVTDYAGVRTIQRYLPNLVVENDPPSQPKGSSQPNTILDELGEIGAEFGEIGAEIRAGFGELFNEMFS